MEFYKEVCTRRATNLAPGNEVKGQRTFRLNPDAIPSKVARGGALDYGIGIVCTGLQGLDQFNISDFRISKESIKLHWISMLSFLLFIARRCRLP